MIRSTSLPHRTIVDGRLWRLFTYEYKTPDGTFCGYMYALSIDHAAALLHDMRETAEIVGEIV